MHTGSPLRHLVYASGILFLVISLGTVGYVLIAGGAASVGLYMTVTTLTTVGYGEIHPLSSAGGGVPLVLFLLGGGGLLFFGGEGVPLCLDPHESGDTLLCGRKCCSLCSGGGASTGLWPVSTGRESENLERSLHRVRVRSDGPACVQRTSSQTGDCCYRREKPAGRGCRTRRGICGH